MKILRAGHVLPISSEPVRNGAVAVEADRIAAVGAFGELSRQFPDAVVSDFGDAAILPGLVNCHSHLEITAMRGALDDVEHDFKTWLLRLNDLRAALTSDEIDAWAEVGAVEGARAGVTCFGDIGRYGEAGLNALKKAGLRGIVFQETEFSPDDRNASESFEKLKERFFSLRDQATDLVEIGLSPHAPYTVSRKLFELIARFASDNAVSLTIHAAESAEEDNLLRHGEGFFTSLYQKLGVDWEAPMCSPVEFLERTGVLAARPLLAHCVTVSEEDIQLIATRGARIAHCPKSNAKFGHGYAPFEKFLDAGIAVGLGSDSVASNNVCDLFEESRYAALAARNRAGRRRFITAREVLEAATLGGAGALGLDDRIGTLDAGKQADIAIVALDRPGQTPVNDVEAALAFSSNASDVVMTMVAGREIFVRGTGVNCP